MPYRYSTACAPDCPGKAYWPMLHTPHKEMWPDVYCKEGQNHGVILPTKINPDDFYAQGITGIVYKEEEKEGNWLQYFSLGIDGEQQHGVYFDSAACVTFSAIRSYCLQVNRLISKGLLPVRTMEFLHRKGYIDENGRFNISERFTAKMSGTTRMGNHLTNVWDSIRKHGVLPQKKWDFPYEQRTPVFNFDDFYAEIPQDLKDEAKEILEYLDVMYEWVLPGIKISLESRLSLIQYHLKQAPLQIAAAVCSGWNDGGKTPVPNCQREQTEHATLIAAVEDDGVFHDLDSYKPFSKMLAHDYPFFWVMKGVVSPKQELPPPPLVDLFDTKKSIKFGQRSELVRKLQFALVTLGYLKRNLITGFYYTHTRSAVLKFQLEHNVDTPKNLYALKGEIVGPKTLAKLNQLLYGNSK